MKQVFIGADHAGFSLKQALKPYLARLGYRVVDKGAMELEPKDDYPDFGYAVARAVANGRGAGILVCGSAQGVCMVANKVRGVRAAAVCLERDARLAREHNDANVLCLSGWNLPPAKARKIANIFLTTPFSKEARHARRLKKIAKIERLTMR
jgi:ribose 5-phosphate isomerase B